MRNVWEIFLNDLKALRGNTIAVITVVGLILVPALYAWFITLGFWDPYSATGNIKVAVANQDEGYKSDLLPTSINAGDNIIDALRANDQFDWQFVSDEQAMDGINSGEYYASIVIPKDFSKNLMTVFSSKPIRPQIDYYSNEKENAIAPRVTSTGASTLQEQIDETFTKTVANIALSSTSNLSDFMDGEGLGKYAHTLSTQLGAMSQNLGTAASQTESFSLVVKSAAGLVESISSVMGDMSGTAKEAAPTLQDAQASLEAAESALGSVTDLANQALSSARSAFDSINSEANKALDKMSDDPAAAQGVINSIRPNIQSAMHDYEEVRSLLENAGASPQVIGAIDVMIMRLGTLDVMLGQTSQDISNGAAAIESARNNIKQHIEESEQILNDIQGGYEAKLKQDTDSLNESLNSARERSVNLVSGIDKTVSDLSSAAGSLSSDLRNVEGALEHTANILQGAAESLARSKSDLDKALDSGNLDEVRRIIGNNAGDLAQMLSAPTEINRHAVYAMADNGSAMSAFYTSLALWIGSVFMVALMTTNVPENRLRECKNPKSWQIYLGRYLLYMFIGIAQALVVSAGNILFLGVQCVHPALYFFAVCVTAIVFSNLIYTLVASFGNIGKAIAIIGLVLQLAGSGGIFPVQMSATFFQEVYPWLPFTHSMEAFQGCIAGIYGKQYWVSIALLTAFLVPSLLLGLVLRKPVIKLNDYVVQKLDETEVL